MSDEKGRGGVLFRIKKYWKRVIFFKERNLDFSILRMEREMDENKNLSFPLPF